MNNWRTKLNEYWVKINDWWSALALREKQAVAVGGGALFIFLLYAIIWSPLSNGAASLRSRINTEQKTLAWMQAADKQLQKAEKETNTKSKAVSPVVLLSLLQKQISDAELDQQLTQMKQATNDSIEMHFQKVDFDKVMQLLINVVKSYNVSISQLSAVSLSSPGITNIDVVLRLEG